MEGGGKVNKGIKL
jgi:serine/threonine protein kinase